MVATQSRRETANLDILKRLRQLPWRGAGLALVWIALFLGPPAAVYGAIKHTPGVPVDALGQHFTAGMQAPDATLSGHAQFIINGQPYQTIDLPPTHIYGPMRPQLELPPLVRSDQLAKLSDRNPAVREAAKNEAAGKFQGGWKSWFMSATPLLLWLALPPILLFLLLPWFSRRQKRWALATYLALLVVLWCGSAGLAVFGSNGVSQAKNLVDLVGQSAQKPEVKPASNPDSPANADVQGVVAGHSTVSLVGGPLVDNPTEDDRACERSKNALAPLLANQLQVKVVNAACPGASTQDLFTGQTITHIRDGKVVYHHTVPPQLSVIKQYPHLKFVVLEIGPNDFWWADLLKLCYGQPQCGDNLTEANYEIQKGQTRLRLGWAMQELHDLPSHPKVIINLVYRAMSSHPAPGCPDAKGLDEKKIALLNTMVDDINQMEREAAAPYGFSVVRPMLDPLCRPTDGTDADIQGLDDSHPYHPTAIGETKIAIADMQVIGVIRPD